MLAWQTRKRRRCSAWLASSRSFRFAVRANSFTAVKLDLSVGLGMRLDLSKTGKDLHTLWVYCDPELPRTDAEITVWVLLLCCVPYEIRSRVLCGLRRRRQSEMVAVTEYKSFGIALFQFSCTMTISEHTMRSLLLCSEAFKASPSFSSIQVSNTKEQLPMKRSTRTSYRTNGPGRTQE